MNNPQTKHTRHHEKRPESVKSYTSAFFRPISVQGVSETTVFVYKYDTLDVFMIKNDQGVSDIKDNSLPPHGGREYTQRTIFRQS